MSVFRRQRTAVFQSTLPAWGATTQHLSHLSDPNISIHAPRMGSDEWRVIVKLMHRNFNPRSPHGERQQKHEISSLFL